MVLGSNPTLPLTSYMTLSKFFSRSPGVLFCKMVLTAERVSDSR